MALRFDRHKFKKIREARGLSGRTVGTVLANSPQMCSRWELGKTEPTLATIGRAANLLGVPYTELITDTEAA